MQIPISDKNNIMKDNNKTTLINTLKKPFIGTFEF
jgi:hypothetical protein